MVYLVDYVCIKTVCRYTLCRSFYPRFASFDPLTRSYQDMTIKSKVFIERLNEDKERSVWVANQYLFQRSRIYGTCSLSCEDGDAYAAIRRQGWDNRR